MLNYRKPGFWIAVIAALLCIVLAVCLLTDPAGKEPSDMVSFQAEVLEVRYDSILVKPIIWSDPGYSSDLIEVSIAGFDLDLSFGDHVAVEYNGIVLETYPVRIEKPCNVIKIASAPDSSAVDDQLLVNFNGTVYGNPGTPSPMEIDPSAILGTLSMHTEGRPTSHCQTNFPAQGCSYAKVAEGYAILIDNEWYLFTQVQFTSPQYYLTVGQEGVTQIEIRVDGRIYLMAPMPDSEAGFQPYEKGEILLLEFLTGRPHLRGVTLTARDAENMDLFSVSISSRNFGNADGVIECDEWIITPTE